jgi:hypothetical protein
MLSGKGEDGIGIGMRREGVRFSMEIEQWTLTRTALVAVLFGADPSDSNRYTYFSSSSIFIEL